MNTSYEHLSRDTRIQLLGHFLSKMVNLMHAAEMEQKEIQARQALESKGNGSTIESPSCALSDDSKMILEYLKRVRSASAKDIHSYTGIARSSMFCRLRELMDIGLIRKTGMGKGARYALVES